MPLPLAANRFSPKVAKWYDAHMNDVARRVAARWLDRKFVLDLDVLKKWQLAMGVLLAAQALAVLLFSNAYEVPLWLFYVTKDSLQSALRSHTVTAPAVHELTRINIAYPVALMLLVTAALLFLHATRWRASYEARLKQKIQPLRWVVTAFSGSLLLVTVGLLLGMQDLVGVVLLAGLMVLLSLAMAAIEVNSAARRQKPLSWLTRGPALVAGALPLLLLVVYIVANNVFGSTGTPGYGYWLLATVALGWLLAGTNLYLLDTKKGTWASYGFGEYCYLGIFFVLETAVTWQVFAAVLHP